MHPPCPQHDRTRTEIWMHCFNNGKYTENGFVADMFSNQYGPFVRTLEEIRRLPEAQR